MATAPKRPSKAPARRKRAPPKPRTAQSAKPARPEAPSVKQATGAAPPWGHCWRCADKDACAFEQRCDAIERKLPVHYSPALAEIICERLAGGDMLTNICAEENMPSTVSVYSWIKKHREFGDAYLLARKWWADAQLERIIAVAADGSNDICLDAEGNKKVDRDHIARSKLLVETLKWAMSKMDSAKFGDRIMVVDEPGKQQSREEMLAEIVTLLGGGKPAVEGGDDAAAPTRH